LIPAGAEKVSGAFESLRFREGVPFPHQMNELVLRYRFTQLLVLATFALLFVGGLVTSTDSGLAVPDWPLSYGTLFPPMIGGIRFEHTHRVVAASVGLLTLILAIWTGLEEKRHSVRRLAFSCLGLVVLQGVLGGLTVLFLLPVPISVAHACIGPLFFSLTIFLALSTAPEGEPALADVTSGKDFTRFQRLSAFTTGLIFLQILLGALVRHTHLPGFVWAHIFSAFFVFFAVGTVVSKSLTEFQEEKRIERPALFLGFLVVLEFFLGIGAFLFTRLETTESGLGPVLLPTFHQTLGALVLGTSAAVTFLSRRRAGVPA
jgi:cytochrome c oxidase assembly protein subunit 15